MAALKDSNRSSQTTKGHIIIHVLVVLFGISAWIGVNGIFIQLPVLINISPEAWNLPAYVVLVVQSANVGLLLYMLLRYFQCKLNEPFCILLLLTLGTIAMGLLIFFYSERTVIAGVEHSLILFISIFFNALVGCFSSVLFMPYLENFNKIYLVSYFIGEGLSGVLPSIVVLIQGTGTNANCAGIANSTTNSYVSDIRFSPRDYFAFLFVMLSLSLVSFIILQYSSFVQNLKNPSETRKIMSDIQIIYAFENDNNITNDYYTDNVQTNHPLPKESKVEDKFAQNNTFLSRKMKNYLLILLGTCCFFSNGFFPSIQSYSCLPYGNTAYKLSVITSQFVNPFACVLGLWYMTSKMRIINCFSLICLVIGSYVTYLALMSPTPPLQASKLGVVLVILSWATLIGFISYLKLIIVSVFRSIAAPKVLFNVGAIMQIGSASGAILSFVIINFTDIFKVYDNCVLPNT